LSPLLKLNTYVVGGCGVAVAIGALILLNSSNLSSSLQSVDHIVATVANLVGLAGAYLGKPNTVTPTPKE
jgi:hypothetical protein